MSTPVIIPVVGRGHIHCLWEDYVMAFMKCHKKCVQIKGAYVEKRLLKFFVPRNSFSERGVFFIRKLSLYLRYLHVSRCTTNRCFITHLFNARRLNCRSALMPFFKISLFWDSIKKSLESS